MFATPRVVRPHSIELIVMVGERNREAIKETVELKYVKVDTQYGFNKTQRSVKDASDCLVVIDVNDLYALKNGVLCKYKPYNQYNCEEGFFTINNKSSFDYNGRSYSVERINETDPFGPLSFIEVFANGKNQ